MDKADRFLLFIIFVGIGLIAVANALRVSHLEVQLDTMYVPRPDPVGLGPECDMTNHWQMTDDERRHVVIYTCDSLPE